MEAAVASSSNLIVYGIPLRNIEENGRKVENHLNGMNITGCVVKIIKDTKIDRRL